MGQGITALTEEHKREINATRDRIRGCPECHGKPWIKYEPGCVYSFCLSAIKACPCIAAAPDMETDLLVERINRKIDDHKWKQKSPSP